VNTVTVKNFKQINGFFHGVMFEGVTSSTIMNNTAINGVDGIKLLTSSNNNVVQNNTAYGNEHEGIYIESSSTNQILKNTAYSNYHGIKLFGNSNNNLVKENNLYSNSNPSFNLDVNPSNNLILNNNISSIEDNSGSSNLNYLVYNNSFGQINFTSVQFLDDMDVTGDLNLGTNIKIQDNYIYLNTGTISANVNPSAQIKLYNIGHRGFNNPIILKDGAKCTDCINSTPLNASTVIFTVAGFSNYSIGSLCGSPPETICNDGIDNDCSNEWDYDTQTWSNGVAIGAPYHTQGDPNCKVGIITGTITGGIAP